MHENHLVYIPTIICKVRLPLHEVCIIDRMFSIFKLFIRWTASEGVYVHVVFGQERDDLPDAFDD